MLLTNAYVQQGLAPNRREARALAQGTTATLDSYTVEELTPIITVAHQMQAAVDAIPM